MVSKRQKLARKRYREAHLELFPKPEPTPPKDPDKKQKKKKKSLKFKRKKSESRVPNIPVRKSLKKHPLRVPGMKPGEGCFICKDTNHIAKRCPQKSQWEKNKVPSVLQTALVCLCIFSFVIVRELLTLSSNVNFVLCCCGVDMPVLSPARA